MLDRNPAELFSMRKDILESTQKNKIKEFYSLNKFEYFEMSIEESGVLSNKMNKLTYCTECNILRPPRSFHCNECKMCVEVHDHHCMWVGTCIGKRNIKQFTQFLLSAGLHALLTTYTILSELLLIYEFEEEEKINWVETYVLISLAAISGLFAMILLPYCVSVLKNHSLNLTTNENLRGRWNGHPENKKIS